jgi:hypothetical protein
MPWTSRVNVDVDKSDVGTATAIWNAGLADEFQYSRRAKMTAAEAQALKVEATAARDKELARRTTNADYETFFTNVLNT